MIVVTGHHFHIEQGEAAIRQPDIFKGLAGIAAAAGRIDIFRECQQCPDFFDILHNVADIAGADAETFSCNNCILRSDHGIFHSKEQITGTGTAR